MLEKLIEYLKNLPKEEQERLMQALQAKDSATEEEPVEQVEESTEQEQKEESGVNEQTQEEATKEQELENVEEAKKQVEKEEEQNANEQVEEQEEPAIEEPTVENATEETGTVSQELLDAKVELALVKAGIREDRIEAAKRLFRTEIQSIEDLEKLKDLIKEFPEWLAKKEQGKGFGIPIKEHGTSLTEEEKKLKSMGIDPKN